MAVKNKPKYQEELGEVLSFVEEPQQKQKSNKKKKQTLPLQNSTVASDCNVTSAAPVPVNIDQRLQYCLISKSGAALFWGSPFERGQVLINGIAVFLVCTFFIMHSLLLVLPQSSLKKLCTPKMALQLFLLRSSVLLSVIQKLVLLRQQ